MSEAIHRSGAPIVPPEGNRHFEWDDARKVYQDLASPDETTRLHAVPAAVRYWVEGTSKLLFHGRLLQMMVDDVSVEVRAAAVLRLHGALRGDYALPLCEAAYDPDLLVRYKLAECLDENDLRYRETSTLATMLYLCGDPESLVANKARFRLIGAALRLERPLTLPPETVAAALAMWTDRPWGPDVTGSLVETLRGAQLGMVYHPDHVRDAEALIALTEAMSREVVARREAHLTAPTTTKGTAPKVRL